MYKCKDEDFKCEYKNKNNECNLKADVLCDRLVYVSEGEGLVDIVKKIRDIITNEANEEISSKLKLTADLVVTKLMLMEYDSEEIIEKAGKISQYLAKASEYIEDTYSPEEINEMVNMWDIMSNKVIEYFLEEDKK